MAGKKRGGKRVGREGRNGSGSGYTAGVPQSAPVSFGQVLRNGTGKVSGNTQSIRVSHRELVDNLAGSPEFSYDSYHINPGLPGLFPWLSGLANNYESYRFRRLSFDFIPACSTNTAGRVMLGVDFDADDPGPSTKTELASYDNTVVGPAWMPIHMECNPANLAKFQERFTRFDMSPVGTGDQKLYDVGLLCVGTDQMSGTDYVGEIWVSYEIDLITPQMSTVAVSGYVAAEGDILAASPFGTVTQLVTNAANSAGLSLRALDDGGLEFGTPFEGLLTLKNLMSGAGTCGDFSINTGSTTCRSASVLASSQASGANATGLATVRVIAGIGQRLYAAWNTFSGTSNGASIRLARGVYDVLA